MKDAMLKCISFAQAHLKEVVVYLDTMDQHVIQLQKVFAVIIGHRLKLRISKCEFEKNKLKLFDHILNSYSVPADPKKVIALQDAPALFDEMSSQKCFGAHWLS